MAIIWERHGSRVCRAFMRSMGLGTLLLLLSACSIKLDVLNLNASPEILFNQEMPEYLKGGDSQTVQITVNGASQIVSIALEFSADGVSFSDAGNITVSPTDSILSWPVPAIDSENSVLRFKVKDKKGNTLYFPSSAFHILTQVPSIPSIALDSAATTNSREVSITNNSCTTYVTGIYFSESPLPPSADDSLWQACEAPRNYVFEISDTQGDHQIYIYVKDAAGNVSGAATVTTTYDNVPPALALTSLHSGSYRGGTTQDITWTATDSDLATSPISVEYKALADTDWTVLTPATLNSGTFSWTLPSISSANVQVRVKAYDTAGNVSEAVSTPGFVIDSAAPELTLTSFNSGLYQGGSAQTVTWSGEDNFQLAATPFSLDYTADASVATPVWISILANAANSETYSWTLPSVNSDKVKLRLRLTDAVGNTVEVLSSANFTIDSAAPTSPAFARTSAALSNSTTVQYTMTCTADYHKILISESATPAAGDDTAWTDCAPAGSFTVSPGDGSKTLYAFSQDLAGNISTSSSISFTLDQTAPVLSVTPFNSIGAVIGSGTGTLQWSSSDTHASPTPTTLRVSTDGGGTWTTLLSNSSATSHSWTAPAGNCLTCKFEVTVVDLAGNSRVTESSFVVDSTLPVVTTAIINDGAEYAGGALVSVKAVITDAAPSSPYLFQVTQDTTGTCPAANPAKWVPWVDANSTAAYLIPPIDATVKLCVWAKDGVGHVSASAATSTIEYRRGSPPVITQFNALRNGANSDLTVNATDNDLFVSNSVSLSYSENGVDWFDISTGNNIEDPAHIHWQTTSGQPPWNFTHTNIPAGVIQYRAVVKDKATNTSIPMKSQLVNASGWSVYAGSTDMGDNGTGLGARWYYQGKGSAFAVNPKNNDIYFFHSSYGLRKYSAIHGTVHMFIKHGATNLLSSGGNLNAASRIDTGGASSLAFDSNGLLYLNIDNGAGAYRIFQINPENNSYKVYAGIGNDPASMSLPTLSVFSSPIQFDEDNSLYVFTFCQSHADLWTSDSTGNYERRLIKITQDASTHEANGIQAAFGKCGGSTFAYGANATDVSFRINYSRLLSFAVFGQGKYIYISGAQNNGIIDSPTPYPQIKVINGVMHDMGQAARTISYNAAQNLMYFSNSSGLFSFTPKLNNNTESATKISNVSMGTTCSQDNILLSNACLTLDSSQGQLSSGHQLLADGSWENGGTYVRLRVITTDDKISTLFGTQPFFNNNGTLNKQLVSGTFRGIYYKKSSESNQATFPEGLYFIDPLANVFGRVKPDNTTEVLWGNQFYLGSYKGDTHASPDTISSGVSMGSVYGGNSGPLHFDNNGLPWMKTYGSLVRVNADKTIKVASVPTGVGTGTYWDRKPEGTKATEMGLSPNGANTNLTSKNGNFFVIGNYYWSGDPWYAANSVTKLVFYDFTGDTTKKIMGNALQSSNPAAPAVNPSAPSVADVASPNLPTTSLPPHCGNADNMSCYVHYQAASNRLYLSESTRLRYITNPDTPTSAALYTAVVANTTIHDFVINSTETMAWYLSPTGGLYCLPLAASQPSWCDKTTNYNTVGSFASHRRSPNSLTWKDGSTLLYSTGNGLIMQFTLPTGP